MCRAPTYNSSTYLPTWSCSRPWCLRFQPIGAAFPNWSFSSTLVGPATFVGRLKRIVSVPGIAMVNVVRLQECERFALLAMCDKNEMSEVWSEGEMVVQLCAPWVPRISDWGRLADVGSRGAHRASHVRGATGGGTGRRFRLNPPTLAFVRGPKSRIRRSDKLLVRIGLPTHR